MSDKAEILNVDLNDRSYDIIISETAVSDLANYSELDFLGTSAFIITDTNIPAEYLSNLSNVIAKKKPNCQLHIIKMPAGEATKSFDNLQILLDKIFEKKPSRKSTLIALGGGVIGDLTGFAASILLRGVNFMQVPTTLLAQVDSSVGGKTGINNRFGKNLVGAFYQPKIVVADISFLRSLPHREFIAGYAEVVKYALINDAVFFAWLDDNLPAILNKETDTLKYIVHKSCASKADIVAQDEREGSVRALLNLGHTFAHAIEQQCGYDGSVLHGEAVAIGTIFALNLSRNLGFITQDEIEKTANHFKKSGLMTSPLDIKKTWDADSLMVAMEHDKKVDDGKMVFILARKIGDSFIEKNIDRDVVLKTVEQFIKVSS